MERLTRPGRRLGVVDILRGAVIVDMMLVHYAYLLPGGWLVKALAYTDVAMEGFLGLSGFMVGYRCQERFRRDRTGVCRALFGRAAALYGVHAFMVLTISLPLALLFGIAVTGGDPPWRYVVELLFLLRQEGLLHILPTFIPLFVAAIPVLALVERGLSWLVLGGSALVFAIGTQQPRVLPLGDPSVFPVALWQVYFVAGLLIGARIRMQGRIFFPGVGRYTLAAAALFGATAWAYHGHHFAPGWAALREQWHLQVSRFPLNALGLVYRASLLALLVCLVVGRRDRIEQNRLFGRTLAILGRHSLATFVLHVYFAMAAVASQLAGAPRAVAAGIALLNVPATLAGLHAWEHRVKILHSTSAGSGP